MRLRSAFSPRASSKRQSTKQTILATAVRLASTIGIEGLTIGELAKSVGMSKSGLFAHFKGKDQLQLEVLQSAVQMFVDDVMRPAFREPRGVPRIKALVDNWISHIDGADSLPGGSVLIAASIELDDQPGPLRDFVHKVQRDLISNMEKAIRLAIEEKHFRPDLEVELFAWSLYSFVLGYHHFSRMLNDPKAKEYFKRSVKALMDLATLKKPTQGDLRGTSE